MINFPMGLLKSKAISEWAPTSALAVAASIFRTPVAVSPGTPWPAFSGALQLILRMNGFDMTGAGT